jgi:hypothetical protein
MTATRTNLTVAAATMAALFITAAPALAAAPRDRDHDGMPDRWEKRHHVSRPHADPDHDGLDNLAEYRSHTDPHRADTDHDGVRDGAEDADHDGLTNAQEDRVGSDPRDADSDHDGRRDGRENAGKVLSFEEGVITITLANGGTLTASVTSASEIRCDTRGHLEEEYAPAAPTALAARHGEPSANSGSTSSSNSGSGDGPGDSSRVAAALPATDPAAAALPSAPATTPATNDHRGPNGDNHACAPDQIVGAIVHEAEVEPSTDGLVLERLELVVAR